MSTNESADSVAQATAVPTIDVDSQHRRATASTVGAAASPADAVGISLTLSEGEIYEITHLVRPADQLRVLTSMGIRARRRSDGSVMVLRAWLSSPTESSTKVRRPQLRLDD